MHCLTVSVNIYSAVSLISIARGKMEVRRKGEDGREMDEPLVDIFDLLCPSPSP
jgi:hypothetical protein